MQKNVTPDAATEMAEKIVAAALKLGGDDRSAADDIDGGVIAFATDSALEFHRAPEWDAAVAAATDEVASRLRVSPPTSDEIAEACGPLNYYEGKYGDPISSVLSLSPLVISGGGPGNEAIRSDLTAGEARTILARVRDMDGDYLSVGQAERLRALLSP